MQDFDDPAWMAQERSWSERAKRGDTRAFTQIYRTFVRPLYSAVAPITRNPAAADDVLADTFRSAFEQMHTFDTNGRSIYFWLRKMAVNNAFMLSRKYKSGEKAFDGFGKLLDASDVPDLDRMIDWPKMQARVKTVLSQLSERHRRAIDDSKERCERARAFVSERCARGMVDDRR